MIDDLRRLDARRAGDRTLGAAAALAALAVAGAFGWLVVDLAAGGGDRLSWALLTQPPALTGGGGGIAPMLVSTFWMLLLTIATALPIGLGCAVLLAEFLPRRAPYARLIRRGVDVLAAIPSVVFGLFGNAFFCVWLGWGFSLRAAAMTLACMVLPLFVRIAEAGLRDAPDALRLGGAALGFGRLRTTVRLLLPAAAPTVAAGLVLAVGRALAETAALLFTSGYSVRMPDDLADPGRALSVHIHELAMNVPGGEPQAQASALVLIVLLLPLGLAADRLARGLVRAR
ncbi:MAG: phosphate ABC transporter permease PstA [Acidobacteriota bacterium]